MYIAYFEGSAQHAPQQVKPTAAAALFQRVSLLARKYVRFVFVFLVLLIVLSFGAMVQAYAGSADDMANIDSSAAVVQAAAEPVKLTVELGDTLWGIAAARSDKESNIRSYIEKVKALNHLKTSSLQEGQVLLLP